MDQFRNKVLQGDCLEVLKTLPDGIVNCCITSPPYYGLRDYGTGVWVGGEVNCPHRRLSKASDKTITGHAQAELKGNVGDAIYKTVCPLCGAVRVDKQIGLEETPEEYIQKLVDVFHEVKRVLKDDGTLWVNIGDSYWGSGSRGYDFTGKLTDASKIQGGSKGTIDLSNIPKLVGTTDTGIKNKDLVGIPWMLAFALRKDGWYLRQDIIWHKPNPMPESVRDRCTKSHEYIFLLSKKSNYYYDADAIKEPTVTFDDTVRDRDNSKLNNTPGRTRMGGLVTNQYEMRNKRDVWSVATKPFKEAHFATFPEELIEPCVLAGCPQGGLVLDVFFGSGTTGRVASSNGRDYLGIELNPEYIEIAKKRTVNNQISLLAYAKG